MKKKPVFPVFLLFLLPADIFGTKTMTEVAEEVEKVYKTMSENQQIEVDEDSKRKIETMKEIASSLDEERPDPLNDAAEGLLKVVDGIESESWVDIVTGSLDIVAAIAMFGGPFGAGASTVLSFISTCIGLFGGTSESTEDMVGRVMEKKLHEARTEDFKGKVRGLKAILADVKLTLKQVRKDNTTFSKDQFDTLKRLKVLGIDLSAQMKTFIEVTCKVTITTKKRKKDKKSQRRSNDEVEFDTTLCMNAISIFGDLSLMRQVLYTDLATAAAGVRDKGQSALFLKQIKNLQNEDKKTLRFLRQPMNFRAQRAVFAHFYTRWYEYSSLSAYMKILNRIPNTRRSAPSPALFACDEKILQGSCRLFKRSGSYKANKMKGWSDKIVSFFIADGYKVKGFELDDLEGREFGPYYGPAVIGEAYESGEWASIQIEKSEEVKEVITVCIEENLDPDDICEQLPQNSQLKTFADWDMKHIKSLYIPKGMEYNVYHTYIRNQQCWASLIGYMLFI